MEKRILLDQLNNRVERAMTIIQKLYPLLIKHELSKDDAKTVLYLIQSVKCLIEVIIDVEYNNNIDNYRDEIFRIARLEGEDKE